jgi:hypothetical protein
MLLSVPAIEYNNGNIPRKCFINGQEEDIDIKESNDHANMTQKGNSINHPPAPLSIVVESLLKYCMDITKVP